MNERAPTRITTVPGLAAAGLIEETAAAALERVASRYAVAITPAMAATIDRDAPDDPMARQFVPDLAELSTAPEELADPIGDEAHAPVKGIVHRYADRVLLLPTHACAVYCRFCFRRERVGPGTRPLSAPELEAALDYIRARPAIREVILTGGDPLILSPRRLAAILGALDAIAHVEVIRIHSRVPIVDPARVTPALAAALDTETALYLVLHVNHARELTAEGIAACRRLGRRGIPLLAQTVLLAGVNADAETLEALFRALVRHRIKPYYLHHPDLAPGTAGFRLGLAEGQRLMRALRGRVSGLCQPTYVLDIPGGHGKVPVGPVYAECTGRDGRWTVTDPGGSAHPYPPVP